MYKESQLEEIYNEAFDDEFEKIAKNHAEQLYDSMIGVSKEKHTPEEKAKYMKKFEKKAEGTMMMARGMKDKKGMKYYTDKKGMKYYMDEKGKKYYKEEDNDSPKMMKKSNYMHTMMKGKAGTIYRKKNNPGKHSAYK